MPAEQLWYLGWTAAYGPMRVDAGIAQCRRILEEAPDDRGVEAHTHYSLARLEAKRGRFDIARGLADRALGLFEDTGMLFSVWHPLCRGEISLLAGDAGAAERDLGRAVELLEQASLFPDLATAASLLADLYVDEGRLDAADSLSSRAEAWLPKDQPIQHARWRAVRARVQARQGSGAALALAEQAVGLADETDFVELQGDCLVALADVLKAVGRNDDAGPALERAIRLYERKGNVVLAARTRSRLTSTRPTGR